MSYDPNIPQSTSKRVISQRQIQSNYTAIFNAFARNHSPLGNQDLQGKHDVLVLRSQSGDPTTSATQIAIYNKLVSGIPNLFYRPNNNQTPIQMTYPSVQVGLQPSPPNTYFPQQYSFVAGPFVVYTGVIINPPDGTVVTVSPVTNLKYVGLGVANFQVNGFIVGLTIPTNITGNTFTIRYQTGVGPINRDVYYLAIGN